MQAMIAQNQIGQAGLSESRIPLPVLIYLLCVVLPIGFQAGPLAMTTLRLFMLIMIIPLMMRLVLGHYGHILVTDIMFVLFIGWTFVSLASNNPDKVVQNVGSSGIEFLGGYIVGRAYIRGSTDFIALCKWIGILAIATLPFALVETVTGRPLIIETLRKLPGLTSVAIVDIERRMGLERVQAVFAHPIHYGLFCSVAFTMSFIALRDVTGTTWRYVSSAIIAFSGFLALSSGAMLAIILQIALICWSRAFASIQWRWWLLIGIFILAYVVIDIFSNRTPIRVFMSYATFSAHNAYWRGIIFEWGMKSVWGHPLLGIGLNDWERPDFMHSGSMDNFWLVNAVRYGIPGFLFLAIGYVLGIFRVMRRDFSDNDVLSLLRKAWVFTFLGLTFTLSTVHIWTNIYSFVFFVFGAGMWMITVSSSSDGGARSMPSTTDEKDAKRSPYTRFANTISKPRHSL